MLLEALIGILIFSIGILALIAMQSTAVTQVRDAQYRTEASVLADRIMGELTLSQGMANATATISRWTTDVGQTLPSGAASITETATPLGQQVTVRITWRAPAASADSNHVTVGLLKYNAIF